MPRDADVPRLPRGGKFKLSSTQLMRIAITAALLVVVIIARQPCSDSVGKFVTGFGSGSGSAEAIMPKPGNVDLPAKQDYEVLGSNMTQAEFDAIQKRAQQRAAEKSGSGSGSGTGSATP